VIRTARLAAALALAGCGSGTSGAPPAPPRPVAPPVRAAGADASSAMTARREPVLPPPVAFQAGLMPLATTGVLDFRAARPTADGRGVVIAILDSGIDPGTLGLITTSTGAPKVADLRDFSGEGQVALAAVEPAGDGTVAIAGHRIAGAGRIQRLAVRQPWYGGIFREQTLGPPPAGDVNGNGTTSDEFPLVVIRASDGWAVFLDSNGDGSFEDEMPLHDYRYGRETIALGARPLTLAANLADSAGIPRLDLYFDTYGHGTAVAGVAAGHNLFNVAGFHGVAPGATLLGLKIANNVRGGISVTGSFLRALAYAVDFAAARGQPLVANLSFGVGNEPGFRASIDSLLDEFLLRHPDVLLVVSAGNDGPGLSTVGFPATADRVLAVGSTLPGALVRSGGVVPADRVGSWSARGGTAARPALVAPGVVFSVVPSWNSGNEVHAGTSFSAPHVAGLAACLLSAALQDGRRVEAAAIVQALLATATPLRDATVLDDGAGMPRLAAAYRWLAAGHQGARYATRAEHGGSAALRRNGLARGDTLERFTVWHLDGLRAARFLLRSDAAWLGFPDTVIAQPGPTEVPVTYRSEALRRTGLYVGTVTGWNPGDTLAGPLFSLVNTIIVPHDLTAGPLEARARRTSSLRVERYFLRVPFADATLHATVVLPDSSSDHVAVSLFDAAGRPVPDAPEGMELDETRGTAQFTVRADDVVPGVYELAIVTAPLAAPDSAVVTIHAELAPVTLAAAPAIEVSNRGDATQRVRLTQQVIGVERVARLTARGSVPETLTVRVPSWARAATVDVALESEQWAQFTDLGITVWDAAGGRVAHEPQNHARGRLRFPLDSSRAGEPLAIELFPAWADPRAARPWPVTVTARFFSDSGTTVGEASEIQVVAGGRATVARAPTSLEGIPEGFTPLLEVTGVSPDAHATAVRWVSGTAP